jgi:rod shape-determining protein MreD
MKNRMVFYPLLFILGLVLQFGWSQYLSFWGLAPNIILIFVIFAALNDGPLVGQWMGFIWGISWDAMSVSMFGSRAFTLMVIGYLAGMLSRQLDESKPSSQGLVVLAASVAYTFLLWLVFQVFSPDQMPIRPNYITILQPFYNVLLAPIIFAAGCLLTAGIRRKEE